MRRAAPLGTPCLLGHGKRRLAPELGRGRPPERRLPQRADCLAARSCLLAEPGRGLLLVTQRRLLTPDDFEGLDKLARQILAFEEHYNASAHPSTGDSPAPTSTSS